MIRVYDLNVEKIRVDSTTTSGYWKITEDGLFQLGHSKDNRPDLPQIKVKLATLDPLGMPLATNIVSGNRADDILYLPIIEKIKNTLLRQGLLFIGDCKMAAILTRANISKGGDFYLCPLPEVQMSTDELDILLVTVKNGEQKLTDISRFNRICNSS